MWLQKPQENPRYPGHGFAKPLSGSPREPFKVPLTRKSFLGELVCTENVQNLLKGSRCCPMQGTLTPATGSPAQPGSPAFKASRAERSTGPRDRLDFLCCDGRATLGTVCTFSPSSKDLGRPGKVPQVGTEATHCISQRPHRAIFANLVTS